MSSTDNAAGSGHRDDFEAQVARLRIKGSSIGREILFTTIGMALAVAGIVVSVIMVFLSSSASDSRDSLTYLSGGLLGLTLAVVGVVLWLRYSLTHYLRYWLLRLIYEERSQAGD